MTIEEKIENLSGILNIQAFFKNNNIESFSEEQLRLLCIKLARENGVQNLDAFFQIAFNTLESKKSNLKFWIPIIITAVLSVASLTVSVISLQK